MQNPVEAWKAAQANIWVFTKLTDELNIKIANFLLI